MKTFVAAGTMATKNFASRCLVIALALLRRLADATFLQPLAIAAGLLTPAGFSVFTGPIASIRLLHRPAANLFATSGATVTTERMTGKE
jgi:hypothetical protein